MIGIKKYKVSFVDENNKEKNIVLLGDNEHEVIDHLITYYLILGYKLNRELINISLLNDNDIKANYNY